MMMGWTVVLDVRDLQRVKIHVGLARGKDWPVQKLSSYSERYKTVFCVLPKRESAVASLLYSTWSKRLAPKLLRKCESRRPTRTIMGRSRHTRIKLTRNVAEQEQWLQTSVSTETHTPSLLVEDSFSFSPTALPKSQHEDTDGVDNRPSGVDVSRSDASIQDPKWRRLAAVAHETPAGHGQVQVAHTYETQNHTLDDQGIIHQ